MKRVAEGQRMACHVVSQECLCCLAPRHHARLPVLLGGYETVVTVKLDSATGTLGCPRFDSPERP